MSTIDLGRLRTIETRDQIMYLIAILGAIVLFFFPQMLVYGDLFLYSWIMIFAVMTLGYNVLFGYTGLLSFGHAVFFGSGAYAVALTLEYTEIRSIFILMGIALVTVTVLGAVIGAISLRSTDVYYALLMLALAQFVYVLVWKSRDITGGDDGMAVGLPHFLGTTFENASSVSYMLDFFFYFVAAVFIISVLIMWMIVRSSFGLTLKTIRENEDRARAMGIPTKRYKWYATLISAIFPGIAGALFAIQFRHITPPILHWAFSGLILFMALLGGTNTFFGPAIGAGVYVILRQYALEAFPGSWQFVVGLVLVVVVLVLRERGVWGGAKDLFARGVRGRVGEADER